MKKEHPVLFSTPMVQAILGGKKTMTRRVVKDPKRKDECKLVLELLQKIGVGNACPYGQVGDHLWVRETWGVEEQTQQWLYKADGNIDGIKWHPSIHMFRACSRITLEITNIRVERLQEITGKDIIKEGAVLRAHDDQFGHNPISAFDNKVYLDLTSLWAFGWDKINGKKYPWASNPWVFVISFKKLNKA